MVHAEPFSFGRPDAATATHAEKLAIMTESRIG